MTYPDAAQVAAQVAEVLRMPSVDQNTTAGFQTDLRAFGDHFYQHVTTSAGKVLSQLDSLARPLLTEAVQGLHAEFSTVTAMGTDLYKFLDESEAKQRLDTLAGKGAVLDFLVMCCSLRGDRADSQDFDFARAVNALQLSELLPYVRSAPLDAQAQSIVGEHATVVFKEFLRRFVHDAQR